MKGLEKRLGCWVLLLASAFAGSLSAQVPSNYDAQIQQGTAELQAGGADRALSSAEAALLVSPDRWEAFSLAGRALLSLKRYEEAADAFSKAIDKAPPASQAALRELRRQCLLAESGYSTSQPAAVSAAVAVSPPAAASVPAATAPAAPAPGPPVALAIAHSAPAPAARARTAAGAPAAAPAPWLTEAAWQDPTGLIWARPWYYPTGSKSPWNFREADSFCSTLSILGYSGWRLPTLEELQRVYHPSSTGWRWTSPKFDPAYGLNDALKHGRWQVASFTVAGDTFEGNRLLVWTSTRGDREGEHVGVYFGRPFSIKDDARIGLTLPGSSVRRPFQGYALCVRANQG